MANEQTLKSAVATARLLRKLGYSSTSNWRIADRKPVDTWVAGRCDIGMFINVYSDHTVPRGREAITASDAKAERVARSLVDAGYCVASKVDLAPTSQGVCRYSGSVVLVS